jgi:Alcohol dehydrogenase GroES-like domain
MRAMALTRFRGHLDALEIDMPAPRPNQVLIRVMACGVCCTDLHLIDGELPETVTPLIPTMRSSIASRKWGAMFVASRGGIESACRGCATSPRGLNRKPEATHGASWV